MSAIAIVGKSGTGKSTSYGQIPELGIEGLDPIKTAVINVSGKDLPFRGWKQKYNRENANYLESSDAATIAGAITAIDGNASSPIENIVIDDAQYIMAFEFMRRAKESGYGKFADIGVNLSKVIEASTKATRVKVFFLWHPESSAEFGLKMKTVGKMVDDYLTLEGLFTVILYSHVDQKPNGTMEYKFITNNNGTYPSKSPVGMFSSLMIPNDLNLVCQAIDAYNTGE